MQKEFAILTSLLDGVPLKTYSNTDQGKHEEQAHEPWSAEILILNDKDVSRRMQYITLLP